MVDVEGASTWEPLVQTAADEWSPSLSPDGQWLAYSSNETGRDDVYVLRFPQLEDRRQISVAGGYYPSWSADGRELIFLGAPTGPPDAVMRVSLEMDEGDPPSLIVGSPERLFDWQYFIQPDLLRHHDVSADGERFLMITDAGRTGPGGQRAELNVVLNWFQELTERVPVN